METYIMIFAVMIIILLLLITVYYMYYRKSASKFAQAPDIDVQKEYTPYTWAKVKADNGASMVQQLVEQKQQAGTKTIDENLAYYAHDACPQGNEKDYSQENYGGGASYMDWVGSNLISPEMEKNHKEYIKNDIALIGVGRAISYDAHDSYMPVLWNGLYRPRHVPFSGTSDQVPEINSDLYVDYDTIRF